MLQFNTGTILKDRRAMADSFRMQAGSGNLIYFYIFHKKEDCSYKIGRVGNRKQTIHVYFTWPDAYICKICTLVILDNVVAHSYVIID